MFPGVPKSMLTFWPDFRSNSGTRLVITARAPPVEMTFISAASTWVARAKTKPTIAPAHFIPTLLCGHVEHLDDRTWRKHDAPHPFPLRLSGRNRIGTNACACRQCHSFILLGRKRWSSYIRAEE